MALKRGVKVEDAVIGAFVLLALLYPLLIAYLIHSQRGEESSEEIEVLRRAYLFVAGLEDCSPEVASRLAEHMEGKLLRKLGGVAGLTKLCVENAKKVRGNVTIEEEVERSGKLIMMEAVIGVKEKGVVKRRIRVEVYGYTGTGGFKVTEIEYAEGS
ncbi:hypothetical protein [Hydrogenivirga sp. 128-5-R1-1]|uniref:hypothetical protein n=1 Tax=Hydrogenivirga sp. 128-5-R1-1 TaxID=392423 RepID=UPI00015F0BDE|nr:hypothetical protein [Hydrogenivirga sp. 128-5-R1-1]EDP75886.1 hypothetical protein HG1285_06155 [Hydrogenivirga sp. 128-5-R1-1]